MDKHESPDDYLDYEAATRAALTPRQRQAFNLAHHGLTQEEIAAALGLASHSTVSRCLKSAEQRIIEHLRCGIVRPDYSTGVAVVRRVGLPGRVLSWLRGVGDGSISPMRIMDSATLAELQRWLADHGDELMREALDRRERGEVVRVEDAGAPRLYVGNSYKTRWGREYPLTIDDQMRRIKSWNRPLLFCEITNRETGTLIEADFVVRIV